MEFPSTIRKTQSRMRVWEILNQTNTPLTAKQIAAKAAQETNDKQEAGALADGGLWLSSIYRALDAFVSAHAVTRTLLADSQEALYSLAGTGHHHYAICIQCKQKTELEGCPFAEESSLHAVDGDFMVVGHMVEVYGYCKKCRESLPKEMLEQKHEHDSHA